jgi:hypothetical protein
VDAASALSELMGPSSRIESAVVLDANDKVLGSTGGDADRLVSAAGELLVAAGLLRSTDDEVTRVEVELTEGGLFVLREGGRTIAATTAAGAIAGIVVYDLRACLEGIDSKPKRRTKSKKDA